MRGQGGPRLIQSNDSRPTNPHAAAHALSGLQRSMKPTLHAHPPKAGADDAWTPAELARLKAMRADNASTRLMSLHLHRTVKSIEAKLAELRATRG
jgi:hypothetical protein